MENKKWTKTYQIILWTVTLIIVVCALFYHVFNFSHSIFGFMGGEKAKALEEMEETVFSGDIEEIKIDMDAADLDIVYGDKIAVSHNYPDKFAPKISFDDGQLVIDQNMKVTHFNELDSYKVEVVIPKGTNLDKLKLDVDAGDIDIIAITCDDVDLDVDAGDINVEDATFESTKIVADAGSIKVNDSELGDLVVSADLGSIDLEDVTFEKGHVSADCGDVRIKGKFDTLKASCDLGDVNIDAPTVDEDDIDVKCSLGNIEVNGKKWH